MPELFRPDEALVRLVLMFPYIPVGVIVFRRLLPRLPLSSKLVAICFFLAQTLMIGLSLVIRPATPFEVWFWDLNLEWNLLTGIASAQLILVAGIALYASWLSPRSLDLNRHYLLGVGLLAFFIALDETFAIHENFRFLEVIYTLLAPILVAVSLIVQARSPRRFRIWRIILVTGLLTSGLAEIGLEQLQHIQICGKVGPVTLSQCLKTYYLEEPLGFLGIWLMLVAVLGHLSEIQDSSRSRVLPVALAILALWTLVLYLASPVRNSHPPERATPASVISESGPEIVGYQLDANGQHPAIIVYFPHGLALSDLGYSVHMIDMASQNSVASHNAHFNKRHKVSLRKHDYKPLYQQTPEIAMPLDLPANRAFWFVLAVWRERDGEFYRDKIVSSDLPLLGETQVILGESVLPAVSASVTSPPLARFDNSYLLQVADLPDSVIAGDPLPITFAWHSDVAGRDDLSQFLHFVYVSPSGEGESAEEGAESVESGEWWGFDQSPLGARLPTRLWYAGLADSETWQVPVPVDLAPGRYAVFTGLYRASDQKRVPVSDAAGAPWLDKRVPLGSIIIE